MSAGAGVNGIEPATLEAREGHVEAQLSFGPVAWIVPTKDNTGFDVTIWRKSPGPLSSPVARLRMTFGPDLEPHLAHLEVNDV